MTFKERLKQEHPKQISNRFCGGCKGCPHDYMYEPFKDKYEICFFPKYKKTGENCEKCWNREIPTEDNTTKNLSKEFNTFVCDKCLIKIEDFVEVETLLDIYGVEYEDTKDYKFKFCPECGRKAVI